MTGINVASVPLKKSTKNTIMPATGPRTLNVFVVPIFPEPYFLMSLWKKVFPTNIPVGNDPSKYAKINNDANFNANIFNNSY